MQSVFFGIINLLLIQKIEVRLIMKKIIQMMLLITLFFTLPLQSYASIKTTVANNLGIENAAVTIRDAKTGEIVYSHNGNKAMRPASNVKLLSGAAALETLGMDYRFNTKLYIDGEIINHILHGNIYIQGSGDPTLNNTDFREFSKALTQKGIRIVTGDLIGDDSAFSGSTLSPGVEKQDESFYFAARTSAITMSPNSDYDAGTIIVTANPSKVGAKPTYNVAPNASGMIISNQAKTVKKGQKSTLKIQRTYNTNLIVISGNLPIGSSKKEWVTVQNPTINTLQALKNTLYNSGIHFSKSSQIIRKELPKNAKLIFTNQSKPLAQIFPVFMKLSNNSMADIFAKAMGQQQYGVGDLQSGIQVIMEYGKSKNLPMTNWRFTDGSGLSNQNRMTAIGISQLLFEIQNEPYYQTFYQSLPVAGNTDPLVGGTLRKRFTATNIQGRIIAKTGYITNVYALSGYMKGNSGKSYVFSIMLENRANGITQIDKTMVALMKNL